ncbi:MAG: BON domain-containing protein [Alphaproteobacteria bacterium]|nr:BON domain-containing protein [Alphaproteobacteria bacterium]
MHTREMRLRQTILDTLAFEPSIDASRIRVIVVDDIVTLFGEVCSYAEKIAADSAVQQIKGVRGIKQEIQVKCPKHRECGDDQIAERVRNILAWDVSLPADMVRVTVERGWVTLSGQVAWNFQKLAAADAVRRLSGVTGITNAIAVQPCRDVTGIKDRIEAALRRTAELNARRIRVEVVGGWVRLEGSVDAWYKRGVAERAAWAASGVTSVENCLTVR